MKKIVFALFAGLLMTLGHHTSNAQLSEQIKKITPELPGQIMIDFGFNLVTNTPDDLPYNWFRSKSVGFYFVKPFDLGKYIAFRPGLGVNVEKFGHNKNMKVLSYFESSSGSDSLGFATVAGSVIKNQLAVTYIDIPLEFRFNFNGNDKKDGLFLAVGGNIAFRVSSHTKLKYDDEFDNERKAKDYSDFNLNNVRYGAYGRIGYRSFSLFYKTYFNTIFNGSGPVGGTDMKYSTIGITLTGL